MPTDTRDDAPSQREALRGWSSAVANEYGSPNKMGAYEVAKEKWGHFVAAWLWPLAEVLEQQMEEFGADEDEIDDLTRRYGVEPLQKLRRGVKSKLLR
jgi:hypothetical protein